MTSPPQQSLSSSSIGVFLARLFSIGPQKTIRRLLHWAVITDCLLFRDPENLEKTDRESVNWSFNYEKQWKQFSRRQTKCLILQTKLPRCQISSSERFIHPQIICQANVKRIYPLPSTERTSLLCREFLKKGNWKIKSIISVVAGLEQEQGSRSHQWRAAPAEAGSPQFSFLPLS